MTSFVESLSEHPEVRSGSWSTLHGSMAIDEQGLCLIIGKVEERIARDDFGSFQLSRSTRKRRAGKWLNMLVGQYAQEHLLNVEIRSRHDRLRLACVIEPESLEGLPVVRVVGEEVPVIAMRAAIETALALGARHKRFEAGATHGFALPLDGRERAAISDGLREAMRFGDEGLVTSLVDLGFSASTLGVLPFIPLIEVAWSDGQIQEEEAVTLTELAMMHGGDELTPMARLLLLDLLENRPPESFLARCRGVLISIYNKLDTPQQEHAKRNLLNLSVEVARAAGGFLGFGDKISPEERETLHTIAEQLKLSESASELLEKITQPS